MTGSSVADQHAGRAVFAQRAGERQHDARENALPARGHTDAPEDVGVGQAERLPRLRECLVERLKCAARGAVEQGKGHDCRRNHAAVPGHDELDADLLERHAERPPGAEQQQQEIAHDRGRQHERQGEHDVQHTLYHTRQAHGVVRRRDAGEKHQHAADRRDAQRVPERKPVHCLTSFT